MDIKGLIEKQVGFITLSLTSGKQSVSNNFLSNKVQVFPGSQTNQLYFGNNKDVQYNILKYSWDGAQYREVEVTDSSSHTKGGEKRKGRVTGAIVGSILLPGVGTVIGAMHGTGKKNKQKTVGHTEVHNEVEEIQTPATILLENISTGEKANIGFLCDTNIDNKIHNLFPNIDNTKEESITNDSMDQLLKLKALLDNGAISQQEFDEFKKKLLK